MKRRDFATAMLGAGMAAAAPAAAFAQPTEAERQARWKALETLLFGKTPLKDGTGVITLDAPFRAQDAALVPVGLSVTPAVSPRTLILVIDQNPAPVAAKLTFGPAGDAHLFRTRVRVDSYTWMHGFAETPDGVFVVRRFIRAAGGCSAPSVDDPATANRTIGQMKLRLVRDEMLRGAREATLLIRHPNHNGMQMDQLTHYIIPPRFITSIQVSDGREQVFTMATGISLSEDPAISFAFHPRAGRMLQAVVHDSSGSIFRHRFDIAARAS